MCDNVFDDEFLQLINASNLAFDVIMEEHDAKYDVMSQDLEDVVEEAVPAIAKLEKSNSFDELKGASSFALLSAKAVDELKQTACLRRLLKSKARELVAEALGGRKNKKARRS
jgi:hypothetical protein